MATRTICMQWRPYEGPVTTPDALYCLAVPVEDEDDLRDAKLVELTTGRSYARARKVSLAKIADSPWHYLSRIRKDHGCDLGSCGSRAKGARRVHISRDDGRTWEPTAHHVKVYPV